MFPVSVETQTAILSVVDGAVSDVLAGSYVDVVSQDKGRGVANVSVVLNLVDETVRRTCIPPPSINLQVNNWPLAIILTLTTLRHDSGLDLTLGPRADCDHEYTL